MPNCITRHIPNTLTCLNLFSGCIACVMAFEFKYEWALTFIIISAVFDFLDGMSARLLNAPSPIGKELDSLADDVSFGVVPSVIVFSLLRETTYPDWMSSFQEYVPYFAFLIAVFSALRLAKFNIDERQTSSFIGLNTPANTLFWAAAAAQYHDWLIQGGAVLYGLLICIVLFSLLLVSEFPMFAFKLKNFSWEENKIRYLFLIVSIPLLIFCRTCSCHWLVHHSVLVCEKEALNKSFGTVVVLSFVRRTIYKND